MAHRELNLRERRTIEDMLNAKIPMREIAAEIGRHVSTIYREIKRNHYDDKELPELNGYYGMVAQRSASQRRAHLADRHSAGEIPQQYHRAGPSFHKENHTPHADVQIVQFSDLYAGRYRDRTHDPERPIRPA